MADVQLSDPVTLTLRQAAHALRRARVLAEEQHDSPKQRELIGTAWAAVQDALDHRSDQ